MGTLSGDGYYQDLDTDRGWDQIIAEQDREREHDAMSRRFHANAGAQVGATIECACCGRKIVKKSYQQRFCPPVNGRRGKRYVCKDRYHNLTNPRGIYGHLA